MQIEIIILNKKAKIPTRSTVSSAGFDLAACIDTPITLEPGETKMVETGVAVAIPEGYFGMVCPRSGLAARFGITVTNAPGIIDSDYRGELKCVLTNLSHTKFIIENNMRIAQMIIMRYAFCSEFREVSVFSTETGRGTGGFGSTGL